MSGTDSFCKSTSDPSGGCWWKKGEVVSAENPKSEKSISDQLLQNNLGYTRAEHNLPDVVQSHISLNVLGEIVCISGFSAKGHGEMRTQGLELVLVRLHTDNGSSCTHVRGEDDIVFACERNISIGTCSRGFRTYQ